MQRERPTQVYLLVLCFVDEFSPLTSVDRSTAIKPKIFQGTSDTRFLLGYHNFSFLTLTNGTYHKLEEQRYMRACQQDPDWQHRH